MLPDPEQQPTISIDEAAKACGIGRNAAYEQAHLYERSGGAEGLPVVRFGSRLRVPTAALRRMLGIDPALPEHEPNEAGRALHVVGGGGAP